MSQSFEKETASSTARSLLGALIALGSGFVFMFLGLVSIASSSVDTHALRARMAIENQLRTDLLNYQNGTVSVSKDQKTLTFRSQIGDGGSEKVTYQVVAVTGEISRSVAGQTKKVARFKEPRFSNPPGLVKILWHTSEGDSSVSWALNRWAR